MNNKFSYLALPRPKRFLLMGMSKEPSVMTHMMATFWPVSTSRKLGESGAPSISRRGSESGSSRRNSKKI